MSDANTPTAVPALLPDLKAAISKSVNEHLAQVTAQGASVLASLDAGALAMRGVPFQQLDAMESRITDAIHEAHDSVDGIFEHITSTPHIGWIVGTVVGLIGLGAVGVELVHRFLL